MGVYAGPNLIIHGNPNVLLSMYLSQAAAAHPRPHFHRAAEFVGTLLGFNVCLGKVDFRVPVCKRTSTTWHA